MVARQGKPDDTIAERAARRSTVARALWCTKCDGENGKIERGSRGCSPRAVKDSVDGGCGSRRWGGSSGLGRRRQLNRGVLRLQEDNGKLRKDVLVLLLASIAVGSGRRRRVTAAARVQLVLSFVGRNPHHGEHYL
jgi:hypothetical protein